MPYELALVAPEPIAPRVLARAMRADGDVGMSMQLIERGASVAVVDAGGQLVLGLDVPVRLESRAELERILPGRDDLELPACWHDAWIRADASAAGERIARRLARLAGARLVPLEPPADPARDEDRDDDRDAPASARASG